MKLQINNGCTVEWERSCDVCGRFHSLVLHPSQCECKDGAIEKLWTALAEFKLEAKTA